MARKEGFLHYVLEEVMGDIPGISSRVMFGGYGIYKDGIVFAMIIQDS